MFESRDSGTPFGKIYHVGIVLYQIYNTEVSFHNLTLVIYENLDFPKHFTAMAIYKAMVCTEFWKR